MARRRSVIAAPAALALLFLFSTLAAAGPAPEAPEDGQAWQESTGYLGVTVRSLNPELRRHFGAPSTRGVLVATVSDGSPAEAAGLQVGDVVIAVDGVELTSASSLARVVRSRAGETVAIQAYRDGDPLRLEATLGERGAERRYQDLDWTWDEPWIDFGQEWAEWGAEFGEQWAEFGAEMAERWGERDEEWGEIGEEIAKTFTEMDWEEFGRVIDESLAALEEIDWDGIGEDIERAMEEVERSLEGLERRLEQHGDGR